MGFILLHIAPPPKTALQLKYLTQDSLSLVMKINRNVSQYKRTVLFNDFLTAGNAVRI